MKLRPRLNNLIIKRVAAKQTTESGIYVTAKMIEESGIGEVLEVGEGVKEIKPGQQIVFDDRNAIELEGILEKDTALVIQDVDVLAVIE